MRYTEYHAGKAVIKDKNKLADAMEKLAKLEDEEESVLENHEKNKVTNLDIIVRMIGDKPYYELKYKLLGENNYNIGYSSYLLDNVVEWKEKYFELVENEIVSKWIPCSERLPNPEEYILLSFENYTGLDIGRYEKDGENDKFYPGDEEETYASYGLIVNAWMPLPEPYKEQTE